MDFKGQKLAEQLCLYIICAAGAVAFIMGWLEGSFALMMKVITDPFCHHRIGGSVRAMARSSSGVQRRCTKQMAALACTQCHVIDGRQGSLFATVGVWERSGVGDGGVRPRLAVLQPESAKVASRFSTAASRSNSSSTPCRQAEEGSVTVPRGVPYMTVSPYQGGTGKRPTTGLQGSGPEGRSTLWEVLVLTQERHPSSA